MNKYLPIKFYQKREAIDDRSNNGGMQGEDPKWTLTGDALLERSMLLNNEMDAIITNLGSRSVEYDYIPTIISVELDDRAVAKSHRSSVKEIFNHGREQNIIGFNNERELLIKVNSINEATQIKRKISNSQKYNRGISSITELSLYKPNVIEFEKIGEHNVFKASLFNYFDYSLNKSVKSAFLDFCSVKGITSKEVYYTNDLTIFRLENISSQDQYEQLVQFPALEFLSFMPKIKVEWQSSKSDSNIITKEPEDNQDYPIVGVLDSGVERVGQLSPWIEGHSSSYPDNLLNKSHGTFVAGIIAYGDQFENKEIAGVKACRIFDAAVLPDTEKEEIEEDELLENIREAISQNTWIKIWNMSLGYEDWEVDSSNFSQLAMALDNIQQQYNVIICKAAGNCKNFLLNKPVGKITVPSESVLSLVVGSVSDQGEPSVFSRTGYGTANIHKPDLVSYGGNIVKVGNKYLKDGVKSFDVTGHTIEDVGTSFSTPRVATLLAGLDNEIKEEFDPLLLKGLAVHSAKYPEGIKLSQPERVQMMGYGIPDNMGDILYNSDHEITLIQSDRLDKGKFMEILEFPYPESMIDDNGFYYGDITVTLVTSPVLFIGNGSEYCQSDIEVKFGTFDEIKEYEISRFHRNEYGPDSLANILNPDKYRTQYIKADFDNPFTRERTLLKYGAKYQPIKKWHVNLSEFTPTKKEKHLKAPKKWALRLKGLYRDFAETRAGIDGELLYQDFCLLITIRDPQNEKLIYNEVTQLLENRNFIHNDIQLRDNIQVRV